MFSIDGANVSSLQDGTMVLVVNGRPVIQLPYPEAAHFLGMSLQALRDRVYKGQGPAPRFIGRRVFFPVSELVSYSSRGHQDPPAVQTVEKRPRGRPRKYAG